MNRKEEFEQVKREYQNIEIPKDGIKKMEQAIDSAKMAKARQRRSRVIRNWGIGLAAALAIVVVPNTSQTAAYAMGNMPVIGNFFKVITVRQYIQEDGTHSADVQIPKVVASDTDGTETKDSVNQVNKSVKEYTDELIQKFQEDMKTEGYSGLDISYETVMDTDQWFTLAIDAVETKASGYEFRRYYHIDKTTGKICELKDLFKEDADYITPISEEIKTQMREKNAAGDQIYFLDDDPDGFQNISENQNFYFDKDGNIVIVFDEYEVGPGYIGCPEFTIPNDIVSNIRK